MSDQVKPHQLGCGAWLTCDSKRKEICVRCGTYLCIPAYHCDDCKCGVQPRYLLPEGPVCCACHLDNNRRH